MPGLRLYLLALLCVVYGSTSYTALSGFFDSQSDGRTGTFVVDPTDATYIAMACTLATSGSSDYVRIYTARCNSSHNPSGGTLATDVDNTTGVDTVAELYVSDDADCMYVEARLSSASYNYWGCSYAASDVPMSTGLDVATVLEVAVPSVAVAGGVIGIARHLKLKKLNAAKPQMMPAQSVNPMHNTGMISPPTAGTNGGITADQVKTLMEVGQQEVEHHLGRLEGLEGEREKAQQQQVTSQAPMAPMPSQGNYLQMPPTPQQQFQQQQWQQLLQMQQMQQIQLLQQMNSQQQQ
ncbi:hypothetical protein KIPB_002764 [Kipferlia bialata]|uniref:Uncharacterized protein n=1 Tax=Kipferlia bialata TaxID=797122 RepID=A0A9K3CR81_9EUKA|nr:hypothetical protein KIPB_002764 [Kipferlia bialata]|eukprot:g2764.t1